MKYKIQRSPLNSRTPKELCSPVVIKLLLMSFPNRGLTWKTCHPSFTRPHNVLSIPQWSLHTNATVGDVITRAPTIRSAFLPFEASRHVDLFSSHPACPQSLTYPSHTIGFCVNSIKRSWFALPFRSLTESVLLTCIITAPETSLWGLEYEICHFLKNITHWLQCPQRPHKALYLKRTEALHYWISKWRQFKSL